MISLHTQNNRITIKLQADLINTSTQNFDLVCLQRGIIKQLKNVYHASVGKYNLDVDTNIHILQKVNQCSPKNILFQIVDSIQGNNPAEADFKGLRIKLNKHAINEIISNRNTRTVPHEIGHLLGWDHPHARAKYESINTEAHLLEQQLTEEERKLNLMSQGWYAQKAGIPLEDAMYLSEKQIDLLLLNYNSRLLNKNFHLNKFMFWRQLLH